MEGIRSKLPVEELHRFIFKVQQDPENSSDEIKEIFESFDGLVHAVVRKYRKTQLVGYEDCHHEGVIGLMIAIEKFDPAKKVQFSTFATTIIKSKIIDYLKSEMKHHINEHGFRASVYETGDEAEMVPLELISNLPSGESLEENSISNIDLQRFRYKLRDAIKNLPALQRQVITLFYYKEKKNNEIANTLGVKPPRVTALFGAAILGLRLQLQVAV